MSKNCLLIIALIILTCFLVYIFYPRKVTVITQNIKGHDFSLELAKTISQRTIGLMNRESLCPNCGMLFVFENEMPLSFWMKNTVIPLDLIFLDKQGKVLNIEKGTPLSLNPIKSISPAKYVIELNCETSARIGLQPNDIVNLK